MISQGGRTVCQGSVAEMLDKPGDQIYDVITHFAKQGKVFNVHFRNIVGGLALCRYGELHGHRAG